MTALIDTARTQRTRMTTEATSREKYLLDYYGIQPVWKHVKSRRWRLQLAYRALKGYELKDYR